MFFLKWWEVFVGEKPWEKHGSNWCNELSFGAILFGKEFLEFQILNTKPPTSHQSELKCPSTRHPLKSKQLPNQDKKTQWNSSSNPLFWLFFSPFGAMIIAWGHRDQTNIHPQNQPWPCWGSPKKPQGWLWFKMFAWEHRKQDHLGISLPRKIVTFLVASPKCKSILIGLENHTAPSGKCKSVCLVQIPVSSRLFGVVMADVNTYVYATYTYTNVHTCRGKACTQADCNTRTALIQLYADYI